MSIQLDPQSPDPEFHDHGQDFQISIPLSGEPFVTRGAKEHQLELHHRYVIAPGEKHQHFAEKGAGRVLLININQSFLKQVVIDRLGKLQTPIEFSYQMAGPNGGFRHIADQMISANLAFGDESVNIAEVEFALANVFLSEIDGPYMEQWRREVVAKNHPTINLTMEYIKEQYQQPIDLDQIVRISHMSKFYFLRLFKEKVGMTPSQYVTEIRLEHAVRSLKQGPMNITAIALDSGFGSLLSFERAFKNKYNMTPSDFQKRL